MYYLVVAYWSNFKIKSLMVKIYIYECNEIKKQNKYIVDN